MIQYTADHVEQHHLADVLTAAAAEEPSSIQVTTRRDLILFPGQPRVYRVVIDGVSVRGVLALERATSTPPQPDLLRPGQERRP